MNELLFLKPVLKNMVWGTENWVVSAHPSGDCVVSEGTYAGQTLSELWDGHRELFNNEEGERFPLLVKLINAEQDLSVQVHPDDAYAWKNENRSLGKAECWYVLDADPEKKLIFGHNATSRRDAEEMIRRGDWNTFLKRVSIKPGCFIQIDPGTVHSTCSGMKMIEIQQNSELTYRLYDHDRLFNGKPRELHIQKALDVIKTPDTSEDRVFPAFPEDGFFTSFYKIRKVCINGEQEFTQSESFQILSVADGSGTIDGHKIRQDDSLIIPYGYGTYTIRGQIEILITSL